MPLPNGITGVTQNPLIFSPYVQNINLGFPGPPPPPPEGAFMITESGIFMITEFSDDFMITE
jgi:hypothetical protein